MLRSLNPARYVSQVLKLERTSPWTPFWSTVPIRQFMSQRKHCPHCMRNGLSTDFNPKMGGKLHIANLASCISHRCFSKQTSDKQRVSAINIEMLPQRLYEWIFHGDSSQSLQCNPRNLSVIFQHLNQHIDKESIGKPVEAGSSEGLEKLVLPPLSGANLDEHYRTIASEKTEEYRRMAEMLSSSELPQQPAKWLFKAGWTRYNRDGTTSAVDFPDDEGLVFDVEVLVTEGQFPTMATAASPHAWYSWCSERLVNKGESSDKLGLRDLISMEAFNHSDPAQAKAQLVIGHNVGFDRSFIREQYYIEPSRMRFLDTLSLHMCVTGLTSFQRVLYMAHRKGHASPEVELKAKKAPGLEFGINEMGRWVNESSLNNLNDVYQLHCGGPPLQKFKRDVFMTGTMDEVRQDFQSLMKYCASDVYATHQVFKKLWPTYKERFPHPVTLMGMMEMLTAYLPVTSTWSRYIQQAQTCYDDLQVDLRRLMMKLANDACLLMHSGKYQNDPWLWNLDWTIKKLKKSPRARAFAEAAKEHVSQGKKTENDHPLFSEKHPAGYPQWYTELCPSKAEMDSGEFELGPSKISTLKRVVPKLLRLTWQGFPLHYDDTHGWGYLVPGKYSVEDEAHLSECETLEQPIFPLREALDVCKPALVKSVKEREVRDEEWQRWIEEMDRRGLTDDKSREMWLKLQPPEEDPEVLIVNRSMKDYSKDGPIWHVGIGPFPDVNVLGCWFYKLPHKDGREKRVGNPLAQDFISKIEDGTLESALGGEATNVAKMNKMGSYWKMNMKRILGQMVVHLCKDELPHKVTSRSDYMEDAELGAILPRLMPAGTITRRAVEPTWLTASNAYKDRIGSELKAMINSPPGYHFVGADVDSQELWIAAILADSHFAGLHGCTAFGWMTLQGTKAAGTDMHSKTAKIMGISRDQAKVFNYGRIYGAGKVFAKQLLRNFNHRMTDKEVDDKVSAMFKFTKGTKRRIYKGDEHDISDDRAWMGGSESALFNKLEMIANDAQPKTPVLGCRISNALEPEKVNKAFMTSRVNWVIQSSAVDYLHLMLVTMRWLIDKYRINARFCISIHDEVRFLVSSEDRYRAALALQITNLLTRAMFAHKLGMPDLPKAVAFFSAVDIDTCLRKEAHIDCITPSNPHGLQKGYSIESGEAFTMEELLEIVSDLSSSNSSNSAEDIDTPSSVDSPQHGNDQQNSKAEPTQEMTHDFSRYWM